MIPCIRPSEDAKTKFKPRQRNTFGMMPGPEFSCPFATSGPGGCWSDGKKKTCYVWRLTQFRKKMRENLEHNFEVLKSCRGRKRIDILIREFLRFWYEDGTDEKFYRLHWSGDIFSPDYAEDLMKACAEVPEITFWNFTRNFDPKVIEAIDKHKPENLVQYLSADAVNIGRALEIYKEHPNVFSMSYMGDSLEPFEELWKKPGNGCEPIHQCPSNSPHSSIEFMCKKCKTCLSGKCVFFKTRK